MHKSDHPYLLLLKKYSGRIIEFTRDVSSHEAFYDDLKLFDACLMNFINIASAIKKLSPSFIEKYPDFPYSAIIGLRNIAAHDYEGLNEERIFNISKIDIPTLYNQLLKILEDWDDEEEL